MADPPGYVLGHSDVEIERLALQARVIDPMTRRFLAEAGVAEGMRVLDVGCGAGDVTLLVAAMVGPTGEVLGFDRYPEAVEAARAKAGAQSVGHVRFVAGEVADLAREAPFDAVVGRYVLQFVEEPAAFLRDLAALVRPGGVAVFHELDWSGMSSDPPAPTFDAWAARLSATIAASGADVHVGLRLPSLYAEAGLGDPEVRIEQRAGLGASAREVVERLVVLARSLDPALDDPSGLAAAMLAEAVERRSLVRSHLQVGAWATVGP